MRNYLLFTFGLAALFAVVIVCDQQPSAVNDEALSNNAVKYFRAGVAAGATVERVKPGLSPAQILLTAKNHYSGLVQDPYFPVPAVDRGASAAEQFLAQQRVQRQAPVPPKPATNAPATNAPPAETNSPAVATNTP